MVNLCLTLAVGSISDLQRRINHYDGQTPFIEVRLDYLERFQFPVLPAESTTSYLATCRPAREGGHYRGSEASRLKILQESPEAGFSLVDLEADLDTVPALPGHTRIVRSRHFFDQFPQNPGQLYREISLLDGSYSKLAVTPRDTSELVGLLRCMEEYLPGNPGIILGMGQMAQITRIAGPFLGGAWTYVSEQEKSVAPGQFSLAQALEQYDLPGLTSIPRLFGVTGGMDTGLIDRTVKAMNQAFQRMREEALAFPLPGVNLGEFCDYASSARLPFSGFMQFEELPGGGNKHHQVSAIRLSQAGRMYPEFKVESTGSWVENIVEFWID